jgi:3-oxoacyl-[acyl-carrier protein] reductase
VLTEMHAAATPEGIERFRMNTALRKVGEPADIARVILFLASGGIHVTGQTIIVDGGKTMY